MLRKTLNLGILAHVDAGKTTLTERLLYAAGVIDAVGSVDDGSTQTDTLALERQRGITIKSAVVSFAIDDVTVNLIDTPGHPDFIAEVERVLGVLDGAVLVVSAVEGVQPQTPLLMRALQRLRVPTLIFVNKIDRRGADPERVLGAIRERLTPAVVPMGAVLRPGDRMAAFGPWGAEQSTFVATLAEVLSERDDALLSAYVEGSCVPYERLREVLAAQTSRALVHPVLFGSAITGAGVDALKSAIAELLPAAEGDADGPVSGTVFKVERGPAGEKIAYVRMFSGTVRTRDRVRFGDDVERKVTKVGAFDGDPAAPRSVSAGEVAKLWGLAEIRIGDAIGVAPVHAEHHFAPPTLETVVVPVHAGERGALHVALTQLAEQDPLIDVRQDDARQELSVSLYGEVQMEVLQATLADDFGLQVEFRETTTIYVERPVATGAAFELAGDRSNPFVATVGLRVDPAAAGSGVAYRLEVELGSMPAGYHQAVEDAVHETLRQGLYGWRVTDCAVTLTHSAYPTASVTADTRNLTPLVLMSALRRAGTAVCEPIHRFHLELPADTVGAVLAELGRLHAVPDAPAVRGSSCVLEGEILAERVHPLQLRLRGLTRGEGVLEWAFERYEPVDGPPPRRPRSDRNPLNREEYLSHLSRRF